MPAKVTKPTRRSRKDAAVFDEAAAKRDDALHVGGRCCAMPDDAIAICSDIESPEAPAVIFNEAASPSALVSWAWSQLATLSTLLLAQSMARRYHEPDDLGDAARAVIVPVMNALQLSEQRVFDRRQAEHK